MTLCETLPNDIYKALYHYCKDDECLNDAMIRALRTELKVDEPKRLGKTTYRDCWRCDKFKELEKENAELKEQMALMQDAECTSCTMLGGMQIKIDNLEKENAELKKQQLTLRNERNTFLAQNEQYEKDLMDINENLAKAKELLKKIERIFYSGENAIKRLSEISDILVEAEQFIKDEDCPDCLCKDCAKDCGIKELGLVEVKE